MQKRIFIKDWLRLKPYTKQTITDSYYLKICNDVRKAIITSKQLIIFITYVDKNDIDFLSCFLTSYFEDIISETNVWNSFVKAHKRLYKKQIPFYNLDDYYEEEINPYDIAFLIWYFLNMIHEEEFISPFDNVIVLIAERIFDVFDKAWDFAPENEYLKSFYQIDENEDDYYIARDFVETILFKTYLFYPDTYLKLNKVEVELVKDNEIESNNIPVLLNENKDETMNKAHTNLLSFTGREWAAEILGDNHPVSKHFLNISTRISGFFLYKGQDDNNIFIEHIASSKMFELTKKSFDNYASLKVIDSILYISIVKWMEEWWFSGAFYQQKYNPDVVSKEKNSMESRLVVSFLDHQKYETNKMLEKHLKVFKDFNNGSQIAFVNTNEIDGFVKKYTEYLSKSLNYSNKEREEAKQKAIDDGYFYSETESKDYSEMSESALVFFNPLSGIEIAFGINCAFPLPNNPFFNIDNSEEDIIYLLTTEEMSKELVMFCIDNCKNDLPFFNIGIGKSYIDDIDFLLRFWKRGSYFSKPSISYTGQDEEPPVN